MMEELERVYRRLLMMVRSGRGVLVNDAGSVQTAQVRLSASEVLDDMPRLAEYGFQSNPPAGDDKVALFIGGNLTDGVVIATGHQLYRMRGLSTGEVAISDDKGQKVYLSAAGIRIEGGSLPVLINASAGLTINGPTTFAGAVTANGHRIDETHRHGGVATGGSNTGVVT